MTRVHIAIGSNLRPAEHVPQAVQELSERFQDMRASPFYETAAIDRPEQPAYWNGVVEIQTDDDRDTLQETLRAIEASHGRRRSKDRYAARTLDLDVLIWDGEIVDDEVHERPFLARCLADLGALPGNIPEPDDEFPIVFRSKD